MWEEFEKYLKNPDLDPETAVEALVILASAEWEKNESNRDDITCLVVYLM